MNCHVSNMALILGSHSSLSVILRLVRDVCRPHLVCINLLLPRNNVEELLPSSATEPHKYPRKTSGNKSYTRAVVHVCKVVLSFKKNVQRPVSSRRSPHKHSHSCTYTEKALCEANHLWACVYLLPGNESGPLMYTFCIYVRTGSKLRSGDRHGAVR